jgi:hypothetical protein
MSADNLTTQYISSTFQRLLQLSENGNYITDGTGSVVSFLFTTSSHALTASYVPGVTATTPGGGLWSLQFNSASTFQGSNNLTFNNDSTTLFITGTIQLSGSAAIQGVNYVDYNVSLPAGFPTFNTGRLHWVDDTKTLGLDTDVNGVTIELGHQQIVRVVNETGVTISKGSVVYITGSSGQRPGIARASYTDENDSATTLGIVAQTIAGSGGSTTGYVVSKGILRGVDTRGIPAGSSLYLSSSGQYTTVKPQAPLHDVRLGKVIYQGASANNGIIYVDIQNGYEIDELHDVRIVNASDGDLLTRSGSLWINTKQLTGSYILTGSFTVTGSLNIQPETVSPTNSPSTAGQFYFTNTDLYISLE